VHSFRKCLAALSILASAASASSAERPPRLEYDVLPVLKTHCVKCHGPAKREARLSLNSPLGLAHGGESGRVVEPGRPDDSLLWQRIAAGEMPPDQPLPVRERELLRAWIAGGAPGLPDPQRIDPQQIEHWAFRPLVAPDVPMVEDASRIRTDIDRFLQSALERQGLSLSPDADRTTLIRRLSYDLTGLPPTPEQITAFLADPGDDAYERLIEAFLESPRYGEHWGKHWLDIAGYADSNGYFDVDTERPLAYRYRDYVIRSLNRDKPFDQFLREQIAGDELANFSPGGAASPVVIELLEATHFLRNGQDGTDDSDGNPDVVLNDRRAAREGVVEIWGAALFGLTLRCAKCHDHKFEPVTQRDYYQLCAVIAPAFDFDHWVTPRKRFVNAPLPDELAKFNADVKAGDAREFQRPGRIAWVSDVVKQPAPVYVPVRGDYAVRGPDVEPAGLAFLTDPDNRYTIRPQRAESSFTGRRLAFAEWLTRPHSRPAALVARTHVNRVWQRYFGVGLVATPENLGYSGATPSHPELIEWLTAEFVRSGWNLKSLHRQIVRSTAYRQSSELQPFAHRIDPDNQLLWRMPLRRLTAEQIRDGLLAASGQLDLQLGGPPTRPTRTGVGEVLVALNAPGGRRRSIYIDQRRSDVPTLLRVFDAPSIVSTCVERVPSSSPLQSLTVLNSELVRECARKMARRLSLESGLESDERVVYAYLLALGREPDADEMRLSLQFLRSQARHYLGGTESPQRQAWTDLCQSLLASNNSLYLD
jgi:hypothetical protein